ncbi:vegetative cell wall protein gp1-like [Coregonus clupeaformis]|uniref:vegetative cell wall protein gp1-like n=1 Tax=Coregonus clupeaformis TaxID=59861 RepID=UPI001E1C794E|nr:vegetative cell wall protein gp1-like [Coregonus clupeaformis]
MDGEVDASGLRSPELEQRLGLALGQLRDKRHSLQSLRETTRDTDAHRNKRSEVRLLDKMKLNCQVFKEEISLVHLNRQVSHLQKALQDSQDKERALQSQSQSQRKCSTLGQLVSPKCPAMVLAVQESRGEDGRYGFSCRLSQDSGLVVIQVDNSQSPLCLGDRLVEVNGVPVVGYSEDELSTLLLLGPSAQIVVLRRPPLPSSPRPRRPPVSPTPSSSSSSQPKTQKTPPSPEDPPVSPTSSSSSSQPQKTPLLVPPPAPPPPSPRRPPPVSPTPSSSSSSQPQKTPSSPEDPLLLVPPPAPPPSPRRPPPVSPTPSSSSQPQKTPSSLPPSPRRPPPGSPTPSPSPSHRRTPPVSPTPSSSSQPQKTPSSPPPSPRRPPPVSPTPSSSSQPQKNPLLVPPPAPPPPSPRRTPPVSPTPSSSSLEQHPPLDHPMDHQAESIHTTSAETEPIHST